MLDMTMGSGVAIASVCLAVPATVKIIVSSRKPKDDKGTNDVLLEIIKKLNTTIEKKVETDYEMLKNLQEMNKTSDRTHFKVNELLKILPMIEQNTKDAEVIAGNIDKTTLSIRETQKAIALDMRDLIKK